MSETQAVPFRSASPVVSGSEDALLPETSGKADTDAPSTAPGGADTSDAPPSLYQHLEKAPYATKHLGLELYANDPDFPDLNKQAGELDKYVLDVIKGRGMKDTAESYKEVCDAILKKIGKSANEDPHKTLKRLSTAANAIRRLQAAKLPTVFNTKSLTPSEFEGIL